jgi:hypothetical protein
MSWVITIQNNGNITVVVSFCYNYKCKKNLPNVLIGKPFSYIRHKKRITSIKTHSLVYKRSPKGFKYGKQRVNFYSYKFCRKFYISNIYDIIVMEKLTGNVLETTSLDLLEFDSNFLDLFYLINWSLLFKLCNVRYDPGLIITRINISSNFRMKINGDRNYIVLFSKKFVFIFFYFLNINFYIKKYIFE